MIALCLTKFKFGPRTHETRP